MNAADEFRIQKEKWRASQPKTPSVCLCDGKYYDDDACVFVDAMITDNGNLVMTENVHALAEDGIRGRLIERKAFFEMNAETAMALANWIIKTFGEV